MFLHNLDNITNVCMKIVCYCCLRLCSVNTSLQPIERPDPLTNTIESHDQILKSHLSKEVLSKEGPSIEELSKMFFTTKHRWYPIGQ